MPKALTHNTPIQRASELSSPVFGALSRLAVFVPVAFVPPAVVADPVAPLEPDGVAADPLVPPFGLDGVVPDPVVPDPVPLPGLDGVVDDPAV